MYYSQSVKTTTSLLRPVFVRRKLLVGHGPKPVRGKPWHLPRSRLVSFPPFMKGVSKKAARYLEILTLEIASVIIFSGYSPAFGTTTNLIRA